MKKDEIKDSEFFEAEYIPKLEKTQIASDNPPGFVFIKMTLSDPSFNKDSLKMENVKREPIQSFMHEQVAKDLLKQLEKHFHDDPATRELGHKKYLM
ncbi:hypothetical protein [Providencia sp.]|uniref:hypothetical protein n=1 Tax=Providencia sp. TaxID=589 RepID=UPI001B464E3A|nr:hypothetical protein [Providencia sp.]